MRRLRRSRRRSKSPLGAVTVLVLIALVAGVVAIVLPAPSLVGQASATDGDSLRIGETRIRLIGLDAVELDQTCTNGQGEDWACGRAARNFVAGRVEGGETVCRSEGRDRYGRVLARCARDGEDLGDAVVRAGWAVAELPYALAEAEARREARGIWSGRFDDPAAWRAGNGEPAFDIWGWLLGLIPS